MRPARKTQARWIAVRPPVRRAEDLAAPAIGFRAEERKWWLWWPCRECGGVVVPILYAPRLQGGRFSFVPLEAWLRSRPCPACETERRRTAPPPPEPAVWYDTRLEDWVVQLAGTILPLEIGWFDAPQATVYRAASDLAHSGEQLER